MRQLHAHGTDAGGKYRGPFGGIRRENWPRRARNSALDAKIATAVVSLAIGIATGTLVGGVATRSVPGARLT